MYRLVILVLLCLPTIGHAQRVHQNLYIIPGIRRSCVTSPNRGINALPQRTYTKTTKGNPSATGHITARYGGMPLWITNPYAQVNRLSKQTHDTPKKAKGTRRGVKWDLRSGTFANEGTGEDVESRKMKRLLELLN